MAGYGPDSHDPQLAGRRERVNFLKLNGYLMHQKFNIKKLYILPTMYLWVLYLSEIEVRECLLPLGAEPFIFQVAIQKFKDQDI